MTPQGVTYFSTICRSGLEIWTARLQCQHSFNSQELVSSPRPILCKLMLTSAAPHVAAPFRKRVHVHQHDAKAMGCTSKVCACWLLMTITLPHGLHHVFCNTYGANCARSWIISWPLRGHPVEQSSFSSTNDRVPPRQHAAARSPQSTSPPSGLPAPRPAQSPLVSWSDKKDVPAVMATCCTKRHKHHPATKWDSRTYCATSPWHAAATVMLNQQPLMIPPCLAVPHETEAR